MTYIFGIGLSVWETAKIFGNDVDLWEIAQYVAQWLNHLINGLKMWKVT